MSTAGEIAAKLSALGLGTVATDIFTNKLPSSPDACCVVYEYPGEEPGTMMGMPGIFYEIVGLQVVFRSGVEDPDPAYAKIRTAFLELCKISVQTLSEGGGGTSGFYHTISAHVSPFLFNRDEKQRVLWACNFRCQKEPSA